MKSYKEEIFSRAEMSFGDLGSMISWLKGFKKPKPNRYEKDGLAVLNEVTTALDIVNKAEKADTLITLDTLQKRATALQFGQDEALSAINNQIERIETRLEQQKREEQERITEEREEAKQKLKEAKTLEERIRAEEELREVSPRALGGIRSGEKRRAPRAFREVFS